MKRNYHRFQIAIITGEIIWGIIHIVCIDELSDGTSIYDDIAFVIDFIVVGGVFVVAVDCSGNRNECCTQDITMCRWELSLFVCQCV